MIMREVDRENAAARIARGKRKKNRMTTGKVAAILVMALAGLLPTLALSQSSETSGSAVKAAPTMPYADMPPAAVPYGRYRNLTRNGSSMTPRWTITVPRANGRMSIYKR